MIGLREFADRAQPALRSLVAQRWLAAAQAEHASIASFNRFSLQLLAVGAPGRLVERCQQAALDEARHTKLCFEIGSVYLGQAVGPGALPMTGLESTRFDLQSLVLGTIEEGCIGESLAALEARAAMDLAEHPALVDALRTIARDESHHAELAFETVAWALAREPALGQTAREAFDTTVRRHRVERPSQPDTSPLGPHGLLCATQRFALREEALRDVVEPAADGLFRRTP